MLRRSHCRQVLRRFCGLLILSEDELQKKQKQTLVLFKRCSKLKHFIFPSFIQLTSRMINTLLYYMLLFAPCMWSQETVVLHLSLKYTVPELNLCIFNAQCETCQCLSFLMRAKQTYNDRYNLASLALLCNNFSLLTPKTVFKIFIRSVFLRL